MLGGSVSGFIQICWKRVRSCEFLDFEVVVLDSITPFAKLVYSSRVYYIGKSVDSLGEIELKRLLEIIYIDLQDWLINLFKSVIFNYS